MTTRIQTEDALKHLFKAEAGKQPATIHSLAGALSLDRNKVVEVLSELRTAGLLNWEEGQFELSDPGRHYAVQVIRAHRLYERFLAEQTGISEEHWHALAEVEEHQLSGEELDDMEARLGFPRYDPHGDPIPSREGEMPPLDNRPLLSCGTGWRGRIAHIEDEPEIVYQQITTLGLAAGMPVTVLDRRGETLLLNACGLEVRVPLDAALNISLEVEPLKGEEAAPINRLSQLDWGESATVYGLSPTCRGVERNRLLDLGIVPGTQVEIALESPSGNPTAYRIRGASIALRREQAEKIMVVK